jgi:hypothetical protein
LVRRLPLLLPLLSATAATIFLTSAENVTRADALALPKVQRGEGPLLDGIQRLEGEERKREE